jgi:hypothetical protein
LDVKSKASTAKPEFTNYVCDKEALGYYGVNQIIDFFQNQEATLQDHDKYFVSVNTEGCEQKFEVDSGAGFTFIPRDKFHKLNTSAQLQNSTVAFHSYTGSVFLPDGKVEVNVEYQGRISPEELYVVIKEYDALPG